MFDRWRGELPPGNRRLWLVRHGSVERSAEGRCYGAKDVGLSQAGYGELQRLSLALTGCQIQRIVTSPRRRSLQSARILGQGRGLNVEVDERLRELDFGAFEGQRYDAIEQDYPELYRLWMTRPTAVRFPGGERYADLERRAAAAMRDLRERSVLVVAHGGTLRAILRSALGLPRENIFRLDINCASLTILDHVEDTPILRLLNGHV